MKTALIKHKYIYLVFVFSSFVAQGSAIYVSRIKNLSRSCDEEFVSSRSIYDEEKERRDRRDKQEESKREESQQQASRLILITEAITIPATMHVFCEPRVKEVEPEEEYEARKEAGYYRDKIDHEHKEKIEQEEHDRFYWQEKEAALELEAIKIKKIKEARLAAVVIECGKTFEIKNRKEDEQEKIKEAEDNKEHEELTDKTLKIFIPTKSFYKQNKAAITASREFEGHPVFIPESLKEDEELDISSRVHFDKVFEKMKSFKDDKSSLVFKYNKSLIDRFGSECLIEERADIAKSTVSSYGSVREFNSSFNSYGSFNPLDPKDKDKQDQPVLAGLVGSAIAAMAEIVGATVATAECAGSAAGALTFTGPAIPVFAGTVVIGYLATISIPGIKYPVVVEIARDTSKMTKEEYASYSAGKQEYDKITEQQNILMRSKNINEAALGNGIYRIGSCLDPIIDGPIVDPRLMYFYGNGQMLLDFSSEVSGSSDRFAIQDGNVIKFTKNENKNGEYYTATVVEDLATLSKKDKASLPYWVSEKAKEKIRADKKQRKNDTNRNSSGPDKDPEKDPKNKSGNVAASAAAANEVKKKVSDMQYTGSPKHHQNSKGNASKPPHDGQKALDESVLVKTKETGLETRVGIENGKVVKFQEQEPGKYHGYIEENYQTIDAESKKALFQAGLIKNIKTGKPAK